ncbi:GLUG motif-containing protein [uncultured Phascolarctobacterium sp.]|uniref:beta strand repeat-containing protein n=1 Tax=uncultured Phascolarctobacterium sp. TaxID=512296 RepID=UPI00265D2150|nr:GLUG motif-containing protein [uncultured Phascolarctobacterium sp.]
MQRGTGLLSKKILASLLSGGMLLLPNWGYALPSGGNVVTQNGSIVTNGSSMNITGSGNVAINWNSFDIAQNETVNFQKMNAVLNYVSGGSRSEIYGKINGAGVNMFLVNPSGVLFGKTAQVNVGQLTASTRRLEAGALTGFNGSLAPLTAAKAAEVQADIINLGKLKAGKLVLEGNNLSIIGADTLDVADKSQITLRANENINIGYEVTDKTTIDVGDGLGNIHQVSDYGKGGGTKASDVLSSASVTDLTGGATSINDAMLVHDVYELQAIDKNIGNVNGSNYVVGNYMLAGDIDAEVTKNWNSGRGFDPIGRLERVSDDVTGSFSGNFDGMGYSIKNLYIKQIENWDDGYIGLFEGIGKGGSVGNVNIAGGHIEGTSNFGSIAGLNWGTIYNIINSAELVCSSGGVGGIVGTNGGVIRNAVNNGRLTIDGRSGGITGSNGDTVWGNAGILIDVKNNGNITSETMGNIGGITGSNSAGSSITGAENTGLVELKDGGGSEVGGISGDNDGLIENVKNSGIIKGHIYGTNIMGVSCVGGIVGENNAGGVVKNAENSGAVSGDSTVGGVAGSNEGRLEATRNIAAGTITANRMSVGGVTGYNTGTIKDSYNNAVINCGTIYAGGIAGSNGTGNLKGSIINSYNTGAVTGNNLVGGITGRNDPGSLITASYNTGNVTGIKADGSGFSQVGGISGYNKGTINGESYNTGSVEGVGKAVGGIVGYNYETSDISNVYNTGNVTGSDYYVGGIVGYTAGDIVNVYNTGNIKGTQYVGGITGRAQSGKIENSWNTGKITGSHYLGGIAGYSADTISESYNEGEIIGTGSSQYLGGIIGYAKDTLSNVHNTGNVSGGVYYLGGIAGFTVSDIVDAYNKGAIGNNGAKQVGGIAGQSKGARVTGCWNSGMITGIQSLGGIVGYNSSEISNSYNEGDITGDGTTTFAGGITGYNINSVVTNVYNLGSITGCSANFGEISGAGNSTITNAYYKTDAGYKKYDDDTEYVTVEAFNEAFLAGMQESDKALWLTYGDKTTMLLKGLLKPLDINIGNIEAEYTGSDYTGLAQAIADKLAEQGIIIDVAKLLADSKTEIGEYDLSDLLYSTQDGYALNVTGKLIIKEKAVDPVLPVEPVAPMADAKYTGSLTHLKTEKTQQEEYRNLDKRRNNLLEYVSVVVDGDGIKLEETEE